MSHAPPKLTQENEIQCSQVNCNHLQVQIWRDEKLSRTECLKCTLVWPIVETFDQAKRYRKVLEVANSMRLKPELKVIADG